MQKKHTTHRGWEKKITFRKSNTFSWISITWWSYDRFAVTKHAWERCRVWMCEPHVFIKSNYDNWNFFCGLINSVLDVRCKSQVWLIAFSLLRICEFKHHVSIVLYMYHFPEESFIHNKRWHYSAERTCKHDIRDVKAFEKANVEWLWRDMEEPIKKLYLMRKKILSDRYISTHITQHS